MNTVITSITDAACTNRVNRNGVTPEMQRARATVRHLRRWADHQDMAEGRMMMAAVELAILDLASHEHRRGALRWLAHCDKTLVMSYLGLDGDAVRLAVRRAGLGAEEPLKNAA